jgi:hypothetical protein
VHHDCATNQQQQVERHGNCAHFEKALEADVQFFLAQGNEPQNRRQRAVIARFGPKSTAMNTDAAVKLFACTACSALPARSPNGRLFTRLFARPTTTAAI